MMPLQRHIKNVVHNYTEAERKVREATSNDPWGPSSTLMSEIADRTYNVIAFTETMQMIWRRLNDKSKNWRHVYKALILLDYIIKTGSDKVAVQCRENIHAIETLMEGLLVFLRDFYYVEDGKDVGNSVREKARSLNALLRDEERLQEERAKALLARERLMHGGALGASGPSAYSPPSMSAFGRSASSYGDERRPSSQPSFSGAAFRLDQSDHATFGDWQKRICRVFSLMKVIVMATEGSQTSFNQQNNYRIEARTLWYYICEQCGISSDLDSAQPQSYTEEQLQLQLALAISKEEHECELQKRHEEEAKEALKLQMVLEQSKREEQREEPNIEPCHSIVTYIWFKLQTAVYYDYSIPQTQEKVKNLTLSIMKKVKFDELMNKQKFSHVFNIAARVFQDFVGEEAILTIVMIALNSDSDHQIDLIIWNETTNRAAQAATSSLLSDADPSSSATETGNGGGLFSLIDTSLSAAPANMPDPWSTIAPAAATTINGNSSNSTNHALISPGSAAITSPFNTPAAAFIAPVQMNNTNSAPGGNQLSLVDSSPWSPKDMLQSQQSHTVPVANNNPWAALDPLESAFPSTSAPSQNGNGNNNAFDLGDFTSTTSSEATAATGILNSSASTTSSGNSTTTATATTATPTRKRTPADFLGDHKDLVDLEKLVDRNPERSTALASTNPFATSTRPLTGHSTNPFSANQPPKPSLNQLSSAAALANGAPMALMGAPVNRTPSAFTTFTGQQQRYGVAQPSHPFFNPGHSIAQSMPAPPNQVPKSQPQQSLNPFF
ncbi:hypothetical protein ACTXT7_005101 [Hymenolepis weldensis]